MCCAKAIAPDGPETYPFRLRWPHRGCPLTPFVLALLIAAQDPVPAGPPADEPEDGGPAALAPAVETPGVVAPFVDTPAAQPIYTPEVRPYEPPPVLAGPSSRAPVEPPSEPVTVDRYRRQYEGAPAPQEEAYEAGVRNSVLAAQARMGPLDGAWRLMEADGTPLFSFLFNDPAEGETEGAFRDLRATSAAHGSGFLTSARREGRSVVMRFYEPGMTETSTLELDPSTGGRWVGRLLSPGGGARRVVMARVRP